MSLKEIKNEVLHADKLRKFSKSDLPKNIFDIFNVEYTRENQLIYFQQLLRIATPNKGTLNVDLESNYISFNSYNRYGWIICTFTKTPIIKTLEEMQIYIKDKIGLIPTYISNISSKDVFQFSFYFPSNITIKYRLPHQQILGLKKVKFLTDIRKALFYFLKCDIHIKNEKYYNPLLDDNMIFFGYVFELTHFKDITYQHRKLKKEQYAKAKINNKTPAENEVKNKKLFNFYMQGCDEIIEILKSDDLIKIIELIYKFTAIDMDEYDNFLISNIIASIKFLQKNTNVYAKTIQTNGFMNMYDLHGSLSNSSKYIEIYLRQYASSKYTLSIAKKDISDARKTLVSNTYNKLKIVIKYIIDNEEKNPLTLSTYEIIKTSKYLVSNGTIDKASSHHSIKKYMPKILKELTL